MLQIITGRFFEGSECHITDQKGVLFSNYQWVRPIGLIVGTFEPVGDGTPSSWVWSYQHRHPKTPGNFSVVRVGSDEVLDQFRCFAIFGLRAFFAFQQRNVEHLCRNRRSSQGDGSPPSGYVPRIFDTQISGSEAEEKEFQALLEKAIKLPREKYRAVIGALRAHRDALEALDSNVDLSYSILVYALESLAQRFDQFTPTWELYEQTVREDLDATLQDVPQDKADAVRATLLKAAHIKLRARFIAFCVAHVSDDYFLVEASGLEAALRRSELEHALGNAYDLRSKYVHVLQPIVHQLRHPAFSRTDSFRWENATYVTVSGLLRLSRHIIKQFILKGSVLESERVNWREQLPDIIMAKIAPEYWIWNPDGFSPERAAEYLSAFLSYMLMKAIPEKAMVNMLPLMEKLEASSGSCKTEFLIPTLCLYWAYHASPITDEMRRPNWAEFLQKRGSSLDQCHIYTMAARVFVGHEVEWPLKECLEAISVYRKKRFKWGQLPIRVEAAVFAAVANKAQAASDEETANSLLNETVLNTAGIAEVQRILSEARAAKTQVDVDTVLGWKKDAPTRENANEASPPSS